MARMRRERVCADCRASATTCGFSRPATTRRRAGRLTTYVFWARRELGGLAAIPGGLDVLTFCGGIGENGAHIRAGICENLEWLGLNPEANRNGHSVISAPESSVEVRIIPIDEEQMIARHTFSLAK